ncbi:C-factor-like [Hypomesus transpacificus]|uniref:C-factor-like n=1 Tax=Hypomesus transpacificus TaxID=137520 RepID=UPI001F0828A7|nr:C-factor-like [Hypomesus transpacificus]
MAATRACSVLITGANRGLGLEMVKQMMEAPQPVRQLFACCRDPEGPKAENLRNLAEKHPKIITVIRLDATDPCSIKESAQRVGSLLGKEGLNMLVNNAGVLAHGTIQSTSSEDMQSAFNTNVMGPMNIIKEFLPYLRTAAKASGKPGMSCSKAAVINISSTLGSISLVEASYSFFPAVSYRVSKAGLNMLTMCAVEEFKKDEILFANLHPGWVRTDMGGEGGEIDAPESVEGLLRVMKSLTEKQNGAFMDYKGSVVPF